MLTRKQMQLLELIHRRIQSDGIPPSFDEMKDALDLRSKSGIHRLITALEERGFIRRLAHRARAIEIIRLPESLRADAGDPLLPARSESPHPSDGAARSAIAATGAALELPVMGRIAAGVPIEAISHATRSMHIPESLLTRGAQHYALEVAGDSMTGIGINDGDVVLIRQTDTADDGDIVVALIDGHEATLKRFFRRDNTIVLEAANPAYETRILSPERVQVQGRLVGLIRTY